MEHEKYPEHIGTSMAPADCVRGTEVAPLKLISLLDNNENNHKMLADILLR
jgi:hypothetical protein